MPFYCDIFNGGNGSFTCYVMNIEIMKKPLQSKKQDNHLLKCLTVGNLKLHVNETKYLYIFNFEAKTITERHLQESGLNH